MSDWEMEMEVASAIDVVNQELRIHGPIEVEQYKMGQIREGVRRLVDYLREKVDRREAKIESLKHKLALVEAVVSKAKELQFTWGCFCSHYTRTDHGTTKHTDQCNMIVAALDGESALASSPKTEDGK